MSVAQAPAQVRRPWIWGPLADICWILLCPLLAFGGLHALWRQHALSDRNLYAVMFCFVVNAHHLPASIRAFGEPVIYRRYKARLWTAALCMPLLAVVPFGLGNGMAVLCLIALFDLWHVAMQQHGLGRIYSAKAAKTGDRSGGGARLDLACTLTWYATAVVMSDSWMVGLADTLHAAGLPLLDFISRPAWQAVQALFATASLALLVAYVLAALRSKRDGAPVAWAKHALHGVAFVVLGLSYQDSSWYRAQSTQNLFHALQYFFIVWVYGHLASSRDPLAYPQVYTGLFQRRRGILRFALVLLLYGLFFYVLRAARTGLQLGALSPLELPLIPAQWSVDHTIEMLATFSLASLLVHFYVDSFIWKVRSAPVRATLDLGAPAQPTTEPVESHLRGVGHALAYFGAPVALIAILGASHPHDDPRQQLLRLRHTATLFPRSAAALTNYGEAALKAGATEPGRVALIEATQLSPSYQGPARALWELARREHAPEAALRWGLEALEAQPEDVPLRRQIALQLAEANRPRESRAQLEELLTIRRGDPKALYALAMLALRDGDADAAETWLLRTRRNTRTEAELAPLLLEPTGSPEQAQQSRASLQRHAALHPDSRLAAAWSALGKPAAP